MSCLQASSQAGEHRNVDTRRSHCRLSMLAPPPEPGAISLIPLWLTSEAPWEVHTFLTAWLKGEAAGQPSLEIISVASAVHPETRRCAWHSWIATAAPPAITSSVGDWLMGLKHGSKSFPSPAELAGLDGSPTNSAGSPSSRDPWDSPVWRPPSPPSLKFAPESLGTAETPRFSPLTPSCTEAGNGLPDFSTPSLQDHMLADSPLGYASPRLRHPEEATPPPGMPLPAARADLRPGMSEPIGSSTAVNAPGPRWAEQYTADSAAVEDSSFSSSWYQPGIPPAPGSGLGLLVDVPTMSSTTYVSTSAESELAQALVPSELGQDLMSEPVFTGIWGPGCSGKTSAAAMVTRSPAVRRAFSGGVVWLDVEALSRIGPADDAALVCRMLADKVGRLPGCSPAWPPLHVAGDPSCGAEELRAWVAVRIANLPGPVLVVLDSVSSPSQVLGLTALGASLLIISTCRAHLDNLRSARPAPELVRPRSDEPPAVCCNKLHMGQLSEKEATVMLLVASGCRLEGRALEAAGRVVAASGRLPKALALLGAMARLRASVRGLPCRDVDLEGLAGQLEREEAVEGSSACLVRAFHLAIQELPPRDEAMYLRLGVVSGEERFTLPLLRALWGGHGGLGMEEAVALVAQLEKRRLLEPKPGEAGGEAWHLSQFLLRQLSASLQSDAGAWEAAETRLMSYLQQQQHVEEISLSLSLSPPPVTFPALRHPSQQCPARPLPTTPHNEGPVQAWPGDREAQHQVPRTNEQPGTQRDDWERAWDDRPSHGWSAPQHHVAREVSVAPAAWPSHRAPTAPWRPDTVDDDTCSDHTMSYDASSPSPLPRSHHGIGSPERPRHPHRSPKSSVAIQQASGISQGCQTSTDAGSQTLLESAAQTAQVTLDASASNDYLPLITQVLPEPDAPPYRQDGRELSPQAMQRALDTAFASSSVPKPNFNASLESVGTQHTTVIIPSGAASNDGTSALNYSDRGELLAIMENTLRGAVGESAVAVLPPSPSAIDPEAGEELHYHYHYHPTPSPSVPSSPEPQSPSRLSPNNTMISGPSPLFRTSGVELVDAEPTVPATAAAASSATEGHTTTTVPIPPVAKAVSSVEVPEATPPSNDASCSSGEGTNLSPTAKGMLRVHISPNLPLWDKGPSKGHRRQLSDKSREQVWDYVNGAMITPVDLPKPRWPQSAPSPEAGRADEEASASNTET